MYIERIELHHFRNYENLTIYPDSETNIFFGQNGSGKTNLLESIHYCALGKSHRINQDLNAVMTNEAGASCHLWIQTNYTRNEIEVRLSPGQNSAKSIWIDQKKSNRFSEMMGILRCVIFSPEDLNLIKDGPAVRRKFLDMMISQISKPYFVALQQYRVAMNQRNAILRTARMERIPIDPMIEDFEYTMAQNAQLIYEEREKYVHLLQKEGIKSYQQISGKETEVLEIVYQSSVNRDDYSSKTYAKELKNQRQEDLRLGGTSLGPHRDELMLTLNQRPMKMFASQGQMRTAALSLKLAQLSIFKMITKDSPVLLLDDVMSELDLDRRMNLLNMISGIQTFITCSDEGDLAEYQNHRTYEVTNNQGLANLKVIKEGNRRNNEMFHEPVFE